MDRTLGERVMDGTDFLLDLPFIIILGAVVVALIALSITAWTALGARVGIAAVAGAGALGVPVSQTAMLTVAGITGALGFAVGVFRTMNS